MTEVDRMDSYGMKVKLMLNANIQRKFQPIDLAGHQIQLINPCWISRLLLIFFLSFLYIFQRLAVTL